MKNIKVIKVLRDTQSAFDHGEYTLHYTPHKWTYPSVGKIYAFQDFQHAMQWASEYPGDSLWEAEAEIIRNGNCIMEIEEGCFFYDFWEWYSLYMKGFVSAVPPCISVANAPSGTVLCNKLRITRRIKDL